MAGCRPSADGRYGRVRRGCFVVTFDRGIGLTGVCLGCPCLNLCVIDDAYVVLQRQYPALCE